jgi:ubiquitin carboxyl-terminal hydrolase 5/13
MAGVTEHTLELVRAAVNQNIPQAPGHYDKVYKDECSFTFETPYSPDGLFINLSTWAAFSKEYVKMDSQRSRSCLYLNEKWHKVR